MVTKGWDHYSLNEMSEAEFIFYLKAQINLDKKINKATEEAMNSK